MPARIDPLACAPPIPPERPEIVVKVDAGGHSRDLFSVRLMYGVGGSSRYGGEVRMAYDASREAFVYRLPAVTRDKVGGEARSISLSAVIEAGSSYLGLLEPPTTAYISFASYCLTTPDAPRP
ncbi:hypothetical protein Phou_077300 [Phytohabitans houttuyneae]|uniref:Uncharacterized protein n=1 Tax=Phytohabitans houttuyneae TaxID=1076126 RepID=A0A6V8KJF0_9ACTN|nr:hypothetical protein Phou_077300 [Phytohabitans houttuyneae]